ncbi:MAG TPA: hypothetical protein VK851_10010 [Anaerolineales bacterium]|nr:hypothetical protein [Anaerolineales bacterium]
MNATRRFVLLFFTLVILLPAWGSAQAQTDARYFEETGHYVRGAFLQYYLATEDPALVYGYPITEQITARDGKTVQYFHKARFELKSDNTVALTPLGQLMYTPLNPLSVGPAGCQQYEETGFSVCLEFLKFYRANGEFNQFGPPISGFEYTPSGLLVQYFRGARFEWHRSINANGRIVITDLGRLYFDQQGEDRAHLLPVSSSGNATIRLAPELKSRAFVLKAVTLKSGTQSIYVVVQDQELSQPIAEANITAVIHMTDGSSQSLPSFSTNAAGIGQTSFDFRDQKPGELITIDITVNYQGTSITTTTSFKVWF